MIYYVEKPLSVWQPGLIMLDLEDDLGHIYVTRSTYDQAILIADRFQHNQELVTSKLACPVNQEDVVDYAMSVLPDPISILAPFFNLIDKDVVIDTDNTRQVIGVLSFISMNIDFNTILKVPQEVRANLVFSRSILKDYQGHFDDFHFKLKDIEVNKPKEVLSRIEQEDYNIVDEAEEEVIDVEAMMAELGWNNIPMPSLIMPTKTEEKKEEDKPSSSIGTDTYASVDPATEEMNEYNRIIELYV